MNTAITLTPSEIFGLILAICGAIITISGAATAITKLVEKTKAPNKKQDERLEILENTDREMKEKFEDEEERFAQFQEMIAEFNERIEKNEEASRQTNKVIIESLQALTAHAIDGNNTDSLKLSKKKLDEYLLNRI